MSGRLLQTAAAVGVALAAALLALRFLPAPWAWIGGAWFGVSVWLTRIVSGAGVRALCFNVGFAFLALGAAEAYLALAGRLPATALVTDPVLAIPDDLLGYVANPGVTVTATRSVGDEVIYRASYRLDERGARVVPEVSGAVGDPDCVLFLGGSFTFGEGVGDDETLPYFVRSESRGLVRPHNLGFIGYGAHQMLAILENSLETDLPECERPGGAVYQGIVDHARRAAGRAPWDKKGPRYVLDPDGEIRRDGFYTNSPGAPRGKLVQQLERSRILRLLRAYRQHQIASGEIELYAAIVARARDLFEKRHPGASFDVVFWDDPAETKATALVDALEDRALQVHRVREILPGYTEDRQRYALDPLDEHPNPEAHRRIAQYVLAQILAGDE